MKILPLDHLTGSLIAHEMILGGSKQEEQRSAFTTRKTGIVDGLTLMDIYLLIQSTNTNENTNIVEICQKAFTEQLRKSLAKRT